MAAGRSGSRSAKWSGWIDVGLWMALLTTSIAIRNGLTDPWDRAILLAFRDRADPTRAIGPIWLPETVRDITGLGSTAVLVAVIVIAAGSMLVIGRGRSAATLLGAVATAESLCLVLKLAAHRARPTLIADAPQVFTASFPSSHAMISLLTYGIMALIVVQHTSRKVLRRFAVGTAATLTVAVGVSRLYLGVHWPSDVIAGWLAGLAWLLLCWRFAGNWCLGDVDRT